VRKPTTVIAGAIALVIGLLLWGCGQKTEQQAAPASQSKTAAQTAQSAQPAQTTPDAAKVYPINWCVVSGEELGQMGDPVVYDYKGRTIKFCCKNCVKIFEKAPDRFMARLDSAATGLIKQPATEEKGAGG
jgi:hypothetical protein